MINNSNLCLFSKEFHAYFNLATGNDLVIDLTMTILKTQQIFKMNTNCLNFSLNLVF